MSLEILACRSRAPGGGVRGGLGPRRDVASATNVARGRPDDVPSAHVTTEAPSTGLPTVDAACFLCDNTDTAPVWTTPDRRSASPGSSTSSAAGAAASCTCALVLRTTISPTATRTSTRATRSRRSARPFEARRDGSRPCATPCLDTSDTPRTATSACRCGRVCGGGGWCDASGGTVHPGSVRAAISTWLWLRMGAQRGPGAGLASGRHRGGRPGGGEGAPLHRRHPRGQCLDGPLPARTLRPDHHLPRARTRHRPPGDAPPHAGVARARRSARHRGPERRGAGGPALRCRLVCARPAASPLPLHARTSTDAVQRAGGRVVWCWHRSKPRDFIRSWRHWLRDRSWHRVAAATERRLVYGVLKLLLELVLPLVRATGYGEVIRIGVLHERPRMNAFSRRATARSQSNAPRHQAAPASRAAPAARRSPTSRASVARDRRRPGGAPPAPSPRRARSRGIPRCRT